MATKSHPSLQELMMIWTQLPLTESYDVFLTSCHIIESREHYYHHQWVDLILSLDTMNRIIEVICNPGSASASMEVRRHAISLLHKLCIQNINMNKQIIAAAVSLKQNEFLEKLLLFCLLDRRCYAYCYTIFDTLFEILNDGHLAVLNAGI